MEVKNQLHALKKETSGPIGQNNDKVKGIKEPPEPIGQATEEVKAIK
jgi:hypothetical protein